MAKANGSGTVPLDGRFFFAAQSKTGSLTQGCGDSPDKFEGKFENARLAWVDYKVEDFRRDAAKAAVRFGFSERLVKALLKGRDSGYEDYETELGVKIPAVSVDGLEVFLNPVMLLVRKNLIVTIHGGEVHRFTRFRRYAESYLRKIPHKSPAKDRVTLMLVRLMDENNGSNFDHLREIEEQGDEMSKLMMNMETPRHLLGGEIYKMKHALITYLNALWDTIDVLSSLRYGDAVLITDDPKMLNRVDLLVSDVNRQIELSEHMSEVLASGLEVLQSIYNNQLQILNNRMAFAMTYLTIIGTAVLVPNTIATVLSNPAFSMSVKDEGWYIGLIFGSTIISVLFTYWWIRRQDWFARAKSKSQ